jgi:hypothetical protein
MTFYRTRSLASLPYTIYYRLEYGEEGRIFGGRNRNEIEGQGPEGWVGLSGGGFGDGQAEPSRGSPQVGQGGVGPGKVGPSPKKMEGCAIARGSDHDDPSAAAPCGRLQGIDSIRWSSAGKSEYGYKVRSVKYLFYLTSISNQKTSLHRFL